MWISRKRWNLLEERVADLETNGSLLSNINTCELVEELKKREGVETIYAGPHESNLNVVSGPACMLIVTD